MTTDVVTAVGSVATALAVLIAVVQLHLNWRQARTRFEDGLTAVYRQLVWELPIGAFLDEELSPREIWEARGAFYRYFDLCNEQAFLSKGRFRGRISTRTWSEWQAGIESNMSRSAFRAAWLHLEPRIGPDFAEFKEILSRFDGGSEHDRPDSGGPGLAEPSRAST